MGLTNEVSIAAIKGDKFNPEISKSLKFKHWISMPDDRRCLICEDSHGKIYYIEETPEPKPPVHPFCRCKIVVMDSIKVGTATINGLDGADWWIKHNNKLPDYYISQQELETLGWQRGKKISKYVSNKMLYGSIFNNENRHLPNASNRIWYEADINYKTGKRNAQRIVWSNDGLVFVTYDHYHTFYEII